MTAADILQSGLWPSSATLDALHRRLLLTPIKMMYKMSAIYNAAACWAIVVD